jgi:hypothetical protein
LPEGFRVVVPGSRFEPCPHQIEANGVDAQFVHAGEIVLDRNRIPLIRPLHCLDSRHPIDADRDKAAPSASEAGAIQTNRFQRGGLFTSSRSRRRAGRLLAQTAKTGGGEDEYRHGSKAGQARGCSSVSGLSHKLYLPSKTAIGTAAALNPLPCYGAWGGWTRSRSRDPGLSFSTTIAAARKGT